MRGGYLAAVPLGLGNAVADTVIAHSGKAVGRQASDVLSVLKRKLVTSDVNANRI
jgi:hypothetical protein